MTMRVAELLKGLTPSTNDVVDIAAGTYKAGGVNTEVTQVTEAGFQTPRSEVLNLHTRAVAQKFADTPVGLFARDKRTDYSYLFAVGGENAHTDDFTTLEPHFLPPQLAKAFEAKSLGHFELATNTPRVILPKEERYAPLDKIFTDDEVATTKISAWQAQAIAQLLGNDPGLRQRFFGISGGFFADLLTSNQFGLMAMEGSLKFMTSTGQLTDASGKKLRAYNMPTIAKPTDYEALSNGVLPNTVWNWVKDRLKSDPQFQVLRGASWSYYNEGALRVAYVPDGWPDCADFNGVGLRVGFFPRT